MTLTRSRSQSGLPTDYYVPDYLLEIEDQELDQATKGDILDLKVKLEKENISSFDFRINNWDDQRLEFKYSDSSTFDLGNEVHLKLGYTGALVSVIRGIITSLAPQFPDSGAPTLSVGCHDRLFKLKDRKPKPGDRQSFADMHDWEIAQAVADRNGLDFTATREGPQRELVVQHNKDEAPFLLERAHSIDFDCFIVTNPDTGRDTLHFIKPTDGRDSRPIRVYEFEWGKSLISFAPTLAAAGQVGQVTVRGWNSRTKQPISYTATESDLAQGSGGGPAVARTAMNGRQDVVVDTHVFNDEEARRLAISLLQRRANQFNTASGQVIGLADLRPGDNVDLLNLGTRFSGRYHVDKVEHALGSAGFTTTFHVDRRSSEGRT